MGYLPFFEVHPVDDITLPCNFEARLKMITKADIEVSR